ncbi:MAG: AI-2E family transporter [Coriobacteriales bacterium]|jgi:predicted PurR-regulated permease PerM|nr:AI-2E family transporter [Coriobacteriales bacterium]
MPQNRQQSSSTDNSTRAERAKHLFFLVWTVIGVVSLVVAAGFVLGQVLSVLAIIGFAAFIVFVLRVPVAFLEQRRVPRWAGSLISYIGLLLLVGLVLLLFVPLITEQVIGLIQLLPGYINQASEAFNTFYQQYSYLLEDSNIQQVVGSAASTLSTWAANLVSNSAQGVINLGTGVVTSIVVLSMALIVGFWVLKDLPIIGRELRVVIGPRREESVLFIATVVSRSFGGYLRGITVAGVCTGTIAGIGYALIGLPYPAVLGLLTGLMNFIPYLGPWISGIVVVLIGLFVSPLVALLALIVTLLAQQITDNFITPRVMSSVVELHPAIVLVGVFAGGILGGVPGLIIAIPLLASAKAVFVYYFEKRTGRRLVDETGALFKGRPKGGAQDEGVIDAVADATNVAFHTTEKKTVLPDKVKAKVKAKTKGKAETDEENARATSGPEKENREK